MKRKQGSGYSYDTLKRKKIPRQKSEANGRYDCYDYGTIEKP